MKKKRLVRQIDSFEGNASFSCLAGSIESSIHSLDWPASTCQPVVLVSRKNLTSYFETGLGRVRKCMASFNPKRAWEKIQRSPLIVCFGWALPVRLIICTSGFEATRTRPREKVAQRRTKQLERKDYASSRLKPPSKLCCRVQTLTLLFYCFSFSAGTNHRKRKDRREKKAPKKLFSFFCCLALCLTWNIISQLDKQADRRDGEQADRQTGGQVSYPRSRRSQSFWEEKNDASRFEKKKMIPLLNEYQ